MDSLHSECATSLFALALKEKNPRSKQYLLEQANELANSRSEADIMIILFNLIIDGAWRLKDEKY